MDVKQNIINGGQMNSVLTKYLAIALFAISSIVGCPSSSTRTVETRTNNADGSVDLKTVETEVSQDDSKSCSGVASCTVDFLGDVIAFPFRLVAGVVEAIF